MAHNQALKACLDANLTDGTEILQQSHTNGATGAQGANGPHNHVASGHDPRKRLVDAATRLIQLAMEPEEYLDHLANSVCIQQMLDAVIFPLFQIRKADDHLVGIVPRTKLRAVARGAQCIEAPTSRRKLHRLFHPFQKSWCPRRATKERVSHGRCQWVSGRIQILSRGFSQPFLNLVGSR